MLQHLFLVGGGGGKVFEVSYKSLHAHLVAAVSRRYFAVLEDLLGRIRCAKLVRPFSGLCFYARLSVRLLVTGFPFGPVFLFLGSILPVVNGLWVLLSFEHRRACEEEERFVGNCLAGSSCLLL